MFKMVQWRADLDLAEFYATADSKGFHNNSSQHMLVDCFKNERESQTWILYYNEVAVGSVACHSIDILEPNAYRICARTCVFTDKLPYTSIRTRGYTIQQHQNVTAQFFIPACKEWAGRDKNLYISSNALDTGSQRLVHKIYCPALEEKGTLERAFEKEYRGAVQTFWRLNVEKFYEQLSLHPRWN